MVLYLFQGLLSHVPVRPGGGVFIYVSVEDSIEIFMTFLFYSR